MTELVVPDLDRYEAWRDCMADFGDAHDELHGTGHWFLPEGLRFDTDPDSFAALVALLRRIRRETPDGVPVPSDFLWIVEGEEMVGFIRIAHRLDAQLLEHSGHIGYSIRPSRRREGHASRALGLALERCRELGIARVLVTCEEGNTASERTILARGGLHEDTRDGIRRFWIGLD